MNPKSSEPVFQEKQGQYSISIVIRTTLQIRKSKLEFRIWIPKLHLDSNRQKLQFKFLILKRQVGPKNHIITFNSYRRKILQPISFGNFKGQFTKVQLYLPKQLTQLFTGEKAIKKLPIGAKKGQFNSGTMVQGVLTTDMVSSTSRHQIPAAKYTEEWVSSNRSSKAEKEEENVIELKLAFHLLTLQYLTQMLIDCRTQINMEQEHYMYFLSQSTKPPI